jgi:hypothetical protein
MQAQRMRWGWTLRLDRGKEIVETVGCGAEIVAGERRGL